MKRVNIYWLLLDSLFLVVFNLLFFLLGDVSANETNIPKSVWISYGFIHFAYLIMLITPLLVRHGNASINYSRPLYGVSSTYFLVELLAGVTFILIAPESTKVAVIVQVILATLFLAYLLMHLIANEHTAANVERHEAELLYVKESSAKLQSVMSQITDKATAKKVERIYDLIHSSPVKSNTSVRSLEQQIISEIDNLRNAVANSETESIISLSDKIYRLAEERNIQLKLYNR
jgi:hypothetical protein